MVKGNITLSAQDYDMIWYLSGVRPCSLEKSPGKNDNWVESAGSLPKYICEVARGIQRTGKSTSAAIAIAISRIKVWAAGGGNVDADTRAKAAKALAQWEALKAKSAAKKIVKATSPDGDEFIILSSVTTYSLDQVRDAWDQYMQNIRTSIRALETGTSETTEAVVPYGYVREVYVDFIIVSFESTEQAFYRIPYTAEDSGIVFGAPTPVNLTWTDESGDWRIAARR